ncbi:TMEM175 family protein [Longimicrobium sp.]|uniref:TMEM175 family protein n=1 Tax=Longimicrobium sp. TaxID=2029185 RepID=UPI002E3669E6|nr:TMEM175 family protein [Longimicrobium sp.]HEX6039874.1 TMEM175 family protein [Longimicrobium sp.]
MIRERMMDGRTVEANGFRWRGHEVSRLEALSDAVFGFAITLLVVSLDPPRTATALFQAMGGLVVFALCFAILFLVWYNQYRFFRRYGLNDTATIVLNAVLLFVIVFFVYPLRFVFSMVVEIMKGNQPWLQTHDGVLVLSAGQWPLLMTVFSGGYLAVFLLFALMHLHAYRLRDALDLSPTERYDTLDNVRESLLNVGIALVSVVLAWFGGDRGPLWAGLAYWGVGPVLFAHGWLSGRRRRQLHAPLALG